MIEVPDQNILGSVLLVSVLMFVGFWLERVNGKRGYADYLVAPIPFGVAGLLMIAERAFLQ